MSKDNLIENETQQREIVYDIDQSYGAIVKRQFNKNRAAVWSLRLLIFIVIIGILAPLIANNKPLYVKYKGNSYFPVFREVAVNFGLANWQPELKKIIEWKATKFESVVWPLIPYAQAEMDMKNAHFVGPFDKQRVESNRWRHWLGTDETGHDLFSGMIHGTTIAVKVGVISMSIASFIGIIFGALAGFYGDDRLKASRLKVLLNLLFIPIAMFYAFKFGLFGIVVFFVLMIIPNFVGGLIEKFTGGNKISIPLDMLMMRFIEIFSSIPSILLILTIVAVMKPSIIILMSVIGLTRWTSIARFTRGELLRVRNLEYMEAAQSLGYSEMRTIFKHALPNSLAPVLIAIAFGVASAILTEAGLSFIGIGVEPGLMTWGKLLNMARSNFSAWWLAIIPGFAIFVTVTIYNLIGEGLTDALDPKMKQ